MVWDIGKKEIGDGDTLNIILAKKMVLQFEEDITGYAVMTINRQYIDKNTAARAANQERYADHYHRRRRHDLITSGREQGALTSWTRALWKAFRGWRKMGTRSAFSRPGSTARRVAGFLRRAVAQQMARDQHHPVFVPDAEHRTTNMNIAFVARSTVLIACFRFWVALPIVTKSISSPVKHLITAMDKAGWGKPQGAHMDEKLDGQP